MRLIDADALHKEMCERMTRFRALGKERVVQNYDFASTVVGDAPTVDAVPVVRCEDCEHYRPDYPYNAVCATPNGLRYPGKGDYCNHGRHKGKFADVRYMDGGDQDG